MQKLPVEKQEGNKAAAEKMTSLNQFQLKAERRKTSTQQWTVQTKSGGTFIHWNHYTVDIGAAMSLLCRCVSKHQQRNWNGNKCQST